MYTDVHVLHCLQTYLCISLWLRVWFSRFFAFISSVSISRIMTAKNWRITSNFHFMILTCPAIYTLVCGSNSAPWVKKMHQTVFRVFTKYWPMSKISFTVTLSRKFAIKRSFTRSATDNVGQMCVLCTSVCLCLPLCNHFFVQNISKSYKRILMKFFGEVGRGSGKNRLDFGDDPDYFLDPGSFSRILRCH